MQARTVSFLVHRVFFVPFLCGVLSLGCPGPEGSELDGGGDASEDGSTQYRTSPCGEDLGFEVGYIHVSVYEGEGDPLEGVSVRVLDEDDIFYTDEHGRAVVEVRQFQDMPVGRATIARVHFEHEGYTVATRRIAVVPFRDSTDTPVFLAPREPAAVIGAEGGTFRSTDGRVELIVPPGALSEDVPIQCTWYERTADLPGPLPYPSVFSYAVNLEPDGTTFAIPAKLRIRNTVGLPAGMPIPFGVFQDDVGLWEHQGMGGVTEDGEWLEYDLEHFSSVDGNPSSRVNNGSGNNKRNNDSFDDGADEYADPWEDDDAYDEGNGDDSGDCGGSVIDQRRGTMSTEHELPPTWIMGRPRRLRLVYDTATVRPGALVGVQTLLSEVSGLLHDSYRVSFTVAGRRFDARYEDDGLEHETRVFFDGTNARGQLLSSGTYPYAVEVTTEVADDVYYATDVFGEPGGEPTLVRLREAQQFVRRNVGRLTIHNLLESPFGAGWTMEGLARLHFDPDGSLLLTEGGQNNVALTPTLGGWPQVVYSAPNQVFSAVEQDRHGNLYVGLAASGVVYKITPEGAEQIFATVVGGVVDLHMDPAREQLYATSVTRRNMFRLTEGSAEPVISVSDSLRIGSFAGFDVDHDGSIYVADRVHRKIMRISAEGVLEEFLDLSISEGLNPEDVALDGQGGLYVADRLGQRVVHFPAGSNPQVVYRSRLNVDEVLELFKEYLSGGVDDVVNEALAGVQAIEVDDDGNLYVADARKGLLLRIDDGVPAIIASDPRYDPDVGVLADVALGGDGTLLLASQSGSIFEVRPGHRYYYAGGSNPLILEVFEDGGSALTYPRGGGAAFDAAGLQRSRTSAFGDRSTYTYDDLCRIVDIEDAAQGHTLFAYGESGLSSITDPAGRVTSFEVSPAGDLVAINDTDGSRIEYGYEADTHLMVSHRDAAGAQTEYEYGQFHRLSKIRFETGEERSYQAGVLSGIINDNEGRLPMDLPPLSAEAVGSFFSVYTSGEGHQSRTAYDRSGRPILRMDPLLRATTWIYDRQGQLLSVARPGAAVDTFEYDHLGRVVTHLRDTTRVASMSYETLPFRVMPAYDPQRRRFRSRGDGYFGALSSFTNASGQTWTFSRDGSHRVQAIEGPGGGATLLGYDDAGALLSVTDPEGGSRSFERDAAGNVVAVVDGRAGRWLIDRDGAGDVVQLTSPEGRAQLFDRDGRGRVVSQSQGPGTGQTLTYLPGGSCPSCGVHGRTPLLESITDPLGNVTSYEYDAVGNLTAVVPPLGQAMGLTYDLDRRLAGMSRGGQILRTLERDAAGQVTAVHFDDGSGAAMATTEYSYDSAGRLVSVTTPLEDHYGLTWDRFDNLTSVSLPSGGVEQMTYTKTGRLRTFVDADGSETELTYDGHGRVKTRQDRSGQTTFEHNGRGQLLSAQNDVASLSFSYDAEGNLLSESQHGQTFEHSYDGDGLRTKTVDPWGRAVSVVRDGFGRPAYLSFGHADPIELGWNELSALESVTYPAGTARVFEYDALGRVTSIDVRDASDSALLSLGYQWNDVGNVDRRTEDGQTFDYTYDARDRLTAVDSSDGQAVERYGYDSYCNRILSHLAERYEVTVGDRTIQVGDTLYEYDLSGRRVSQTTSGETTTFDFDDAGRIVALSRPDGTELAFGYDPLGRLATRAITRDGESTTTYHYFDDVELAATADDAGDLSSRLVPGPTAFQPLALLQGHQAYAIHADAVGSVRLLTDLAGEPAFAAQYDSFGQILAWEGDVESPIGFAGQIYDDAAGLSFFWGRAYDAQLGQFASVDPISFGGVHRFVGDRRLAAAMTQYLLLTPSAQHPYAYAHHNPLRYDDPYGLASGCSNGPSDAEWAAGQLLNTIANTLASWLAPIQVAEWATEILTSDDPGNAAYDYVQENIIPPSARDPFETFQDYANQR